MIEASGRDGDDSGQAPQGNAAARQPPAWGGHDPKVGMFGLNAGPIQTTASPTTSGIRYVHSSNFPDLLEELGCSILVSTYQANKLMAVRAQGGRLRTLLRTFPMPMGIALDGDRLALGTLFQIWEFQDDKTIAATINKDTAHDACYLPRACHVTGDIRVHEMAWGDEGLWLVNTRFSCLATLDRRYSFVPRWRPPFITTLAGEDRCHLNGMAMVDGLPKFVTALGQSNERQGWRANKVTGGCLMDVESGAVVGDGLSMPHSPRWRDGKLWFLESGRGTLSIMDPTNGKTEIVASLPGFTRGLDFIGPWALVGLSQVRESSTFSGLPITLGDTPPECGLWVVDTRSGQTAAFLRFESGAQEVFAVQTLPGLRFPEILGFQEDTIARTFVLPPSAAA